MTQVLDHGYVRLVETWGSDERIIESARQSTQKGFQGWGGMECHSCKGAGGVKDPYGIYPTDWVPCCACDGKGKHPPGDEKLLRYLWENNHATPFEFAGAVFEVRAPIFVFREWHRHRTQSYNEASARYAPLPALDYLPTVERCMVVDAKNRQAGALAGVTLTEENAIEGLRRLEEKQRELEELYQWLLGVGFPKELARGCNTVFRNSTMRASANLRNWLGFLSLRQDEKAQWEIRQYANAVHNVLADVFPRTLALFDEGRP